MRRWRRGRRHLALLLAAGLLASCSADTSDVDLRHAARRGTPNEFLACPPEYCASPADVETPIYPVAASRLLAIVRATLADQPRMTILRDVALADGGRKIVAVQRSLVFRFPDTIWIEIVQRGDQAGLAILSRAAYGRSDFGVNRARVETLLAAIGVAAVP